MPDAPPDPTADAGVLPTKQAHVEIILEPPEFVGQMGDTAIRGGFVVSPDPSCTPSTVGSCVVTDCPQADGATYADPGRLTLPTPAIGGSFGFTPGAGFLWFNATVTPWDENEPITLSAAGEEVPAFSLTTMSPRTLDAGEGRDLFDNPPLVRSQPFVVTWVPSTEKVKVILRQGRDTAAGEYEVLVKCTGAAGSGSMSIPAAALTRFVPTASGGQVTVDAYAMREVTGVAGDFGVSLRVLRSYGQTFRHDVQ